MDPTYSADAEAYRLTVRAFLEANLPEGWTGLGALPKEEALAFADEWRRTLHANGLLAASWPAEYGGGGLSQLEQVIVAEEFSRVGVPTGTGNDTFGIQMVGNTLLEWGTDEQKAHFLPRILANEDIWCQGYSEPNAGSDLASLKTQGEDDGENFVLNGQKIWTSTAHAADMIFCLVRTEPDAPKHEGISYLIFSMKTPGIEVRPLLTMTGAAEFNEVFFTDVKVPKTQIVGGRGQGWFVANATLKHERGMLGDPNAAHARLQAIIEILKTETLDGQRLMDHPLYLDRLMQLQARVIAMQANGLRLLTAAQRKEAPGMAGLIVKLQGCELNHQLAALAIDALGELGVLYHGSPHLRDGGVWQHRYMFDLGLIIGGGTAQIQKNIIAERGLGLPREPKLAKS